ncbi:MAG: polynucleotide adenylyltransferase PcnB [Gammaproteobacteria bacterium]|nr:MAG: polynucleotide adenylyltransferase PcnB [Gammaproteobacteria bacterium]
MSKDSDTISQAIRIPRSEHSISRADISSGALNVLYALKKAGFEAYLVGGGVRDLLLGREPKDFDVVTDAEPDEIKRLFRRARLIGRRFRLAHVRFGPEIIEVATFRGAVEDPDEEDHVSVNGRIMRDNVYGTTAQEDARRRDFSVNCLYYDIRDFSVLDFAGGMADLEAGILRIIGDPVRRYREDPVRMLRAARFAAKLGFRLGDETSAAIPECVPMLAEIPAARLYEEVLKLFLGGAAVQSFELLNHYDLFKYLFTESAERIEAEPLSPAAKLVLQALANTDQRIHDEKPVTPAFLFAALLWPAVHEDAIAHSSRGLTPVQAMDAAGMEVLARQVSQVSLPRRFSLAAREIWSLQPRLEQPRGKRAIQLLATPRFRAAYDFLLLRAEAGEDVGGRADWWTKFQEMDDPDRKAALAGTGSRPRRRRRRRRQAPANT